MRDLLVERRALLQRIAEHLAPAQAAQHVDMRNHAPVLVHHEHLDLVLLRQVLAVRLLAGKAADAGRRRRKSGVHLFTHFGRHHRFQVGGLDDQHRFRREHM